MGTAIDTLGKATRLARAFVGATTRRDVPIDIESIAARCGVSAIRTRAMKASGLLTVSDDGMLVIECRKDDPVVVQRYTIAHEIGHILLAGTRGLGVREYHRNAVEREDERTAELIAAELLMPGHLLRDELPDCGLRSQRTWAYLMGLRRRYQVSVSPMALRVLEIPGILAVLLRVTVDVDGEIAGWECNSSICGGISLQFDPQAESQRIWHQASRSTWHRLPVVTEFGGGEMVLDGLLRDIAVDGSRIRQYWAIGWM